MIDKFQLTCSIVLYNTNVHELKESINCILQSNLKLKLYLIDNSPSDDLKEIVCNSSVEYIFNNKNLGYGKAHNIAIIDALNKSKYHLVLNPDIKFKQGVLETIYQFMEIHEDVGQLMPKVFYENGELQKLCHLLPAPVNLIGRRFFKSSKWVKKLDSRYELSDFNYHKCINVPNLSGCFMFLRTEALKKTGGFDERYFMYMEDVDLTRRINKLFKTIFYPAVSITHGFEKESYSNSVLLRHHIKSAIKYFNKWGWIVDKERDEFNKEALQLLNIILNEKFAKIGC